MCSKGQRAEVYLTEDRGFTVGDALFETVLVRHGRAIWLEEHLERMRQACARLDLQFPVQLSEEVDQLLAGLTDPYSVLRLTLSRESAGQRGYRPVTRQSRRYLQVLVGAAPARNYWDEGIAAFVCQTRLPELPQLAGIKHNNRLPHVLARGERRVAEFPEGIMLSTTHSVVEGISSNLFIVRSGQLLTPSLSCAGVAGIARQKVIDTARQLGLEVRECRLGLPDLYGAEELFFCNSLIGLWPAKRLDCHYLRSKNICRRLQAELESVWYD